MGRADFVLHFFFCDMNLGSTCLIACPAGQTLPPMGRWRDAVSPVRADGEVWVRSIGETASG